MVLKPLLIESFSWDRHAGDVDYLAANLRQADRDELAACGYVDLVDALRSSLVRADVSFVVKTDKGQPFCIFGLSAVGHPEHGRAIWLVGTDVLACYKREFLYHSQLVVDNWVEDFGQLYNLVDVRNVKAVRWLSWLGAEFSAPFAVGVNEEEFMMFWLRGRRDVS